MSMTVAELEIIIEAKVDQLKRDLLQGEGELKKFGKKAEAEVERAKKAISAKLGELGSSLRSFGTSATVGLTVPLVAAGKTAIDTAARFESLQLGLENLMGSQKAARREWELLRREAMKPGLGFEQAVEASTALQAMGDSADFARRQIAAVARANALVGGSADNFREILRQFSQMRSLGKVTAENLNVILERAPAIAKTLKEVFGTTNGEIIQDAIKNGKLTMSQFIEGMLQGMEALPQAKGSLQNDLDNMMDDIRQAWADLGTELVPLVRETIIPAAQELKHLIAEFRKLPPEVKQNAVNAAVLVAALGPVALAFNGIVTAVRMVVGTGAMVRGWFAMVRTEAVATQATVSTAAASIGGLRAAVAALAALAASPITIMVAVVGSVFGLAYLGTEELKARSDEQTRLNRANYQNAMRGDWVKALRFYDEAIKEGKNAKQAADDATRSLQVFYKLSERNARDTVTGALRQRAPMLPSGGRASAIGAKLPEKPTIPRFNLGSGSGKKSGGEGGHSKPDAPPGLGGWLGDFGDAWAAILPDWEKAQQEAADAAKAHAEELRNLQEQYLRVTGVSEAQLLIWKRETGQIGELTDEQYQERLGMLEMIEAEQYKQSIQGRGLTLYGAIRNAVQQVVEERKKEARQLADAAKSDLESMRRRIDTLNMVSNAGQIEYEITKGKYKDLAPLMKVYLMAQAKELDNAEALKREREQAASIDEDYRRFMADLAREAAALAAHTDDARIAVSLLNEAFAKDPEKLKAAAEAVKQVDALRKKVEEMQQFKDAVLKTFEDLFDDVFNNGFKNFASSLLSGFRQLFLSIAREILMSQVRNAIGGLLGGLFSVGGSGIGGAISAATGGVGLGLGAAFGGGRAIGGDIRPGRVYRVGENGPETIIPTSGGRVLTARQTQESNSGGVVVNIHIHATDAASVIRSQDQIATRAGKAIHRAIQRNT